MLVIMIINTIMISVLLFNNNFHIFSWNPMFNNHTENGEQADVRFDKLCNNTCGIATISFDDNFHRSNKMCKKSVRSWCQNNPPDVAPQCKHERELGWHDAKFLHQHHWTAWLLILGIQAGALTIRTNYSIYRVDSLLPAFVHVIQHAEER